MAVAADNYERWCNWMLLEHGPAFQPLLKSTWDSYVVNSDKFKHKQVYFGCGHDASMDRYQHWDLCDVREIPGVIYWDILMGLPYADGSMDIVKSKLTLGMLTWHQTKFVMREIARVLKPGGVFDLTFRDFDRLTDRKGLDPELFVRYIYGSGMYYGSRRRACWTVPWVRSIADTYLLRLESNGSASFRGMNSTLKLIRAEGDLKKFSPEPKVRFDDDGDMVNDGGDFPSEAR